ncbi:MAG: DinB family protein [Gemmatimonadales bacterium]
MPAQPAMFISTDALLAHWQGHRRLSRRVIEVFPDDKLFTFSIGGMRTFGDLANEMLSMAGPMAHGMATLEWGGFAVPKADNKRDILRLWDESTKKIDEMWPKIPVQRFQDSITSFGQYTGAGYWQILYIIDNEIHHRGQGYVYLRALGVEPPPFYER